MGESRYVSLRCLALIETRLLEQFFEAFLFGSTEQRTSTSDSGANVLAYNTIAIQFAPKHLGLVLVRSSVTCERQATPYDFLGQRVLRRKNSYL